MSTQLDQSAARSAGKCNHQETGQHVISPLQSLAQEGPKDQRLSSLWLHENHFTKASRQCDARRVICMSAVRILESSGTSKRPNRMLNLLSYPKARSKKILVCSLIIVKTE